jgi:hypothetical protein
MSQTRKTDNIQIGLNYGSLEMISEGKEDVIYIEADQSDYFGIISITIEQAEWLVKELPELIKAIKGAN